MECTEEISDHQVTSYNLRVFVRSIPFLMQYFLSYKVHAIFYQLIATATITFSKTNYAASKRGKLLNLCGEPKQRHLCGTYGVKSSSIIWVIVQIKAAVFI